MSGKGEVPRNDFPYYGWNQSPTAHSCTFLVNYGDVLMPQIMIRNIKLSMILPFPGNYLIHLLRPANGETVSFQQMFPVVERKSITLKQNITKPMFFYAKKCLMD